MKTITVTIPVDIAIMLRDAARWHTEDQQRRRKRMPKYEDPGMQAHARQMEELAKKFDQMRLDGAELLDKAILEAK